MEGLKGFTIRNSGRSFGIRLFFKKKFKSFRIVLILMSIIGIDYEKCTGCKKCIVDCTRFLFKEDSTGKIIRLPDKMNTCNFCGKCISICTENAILWKGDWVLFPGVFKRFLFIHCGLFVILYQYI